MFDELPEPDGAVLRTPPAQSVFLAVALEEERQMRPADGTAWQRHLRDHGFVGDTLRKVRLQTLQVAADREGVAASADSLDGWQVTRSDQLAHAAAYSQAFNLERKGYAGFDTFAIETASVFGAYIALFNPTVRTRITLKYSNALSDPDATTARFWHGKVTSPFLSAASDPRLCSDVHRTFSLADFRSAHLAFQVRSALQPDVVNAGATAYVFEIEGSNESVLPFDIAQSLEDVRTLNRHARQLFQAILTPEYYAQLRG